MLNTAPLVSPLRRFPSPRSPLPAQVAGTSYLLGSPRPRANHGLRAGGAAASKATRLAGLRPFQGNGSTAHPRCALPCNCPATFSSSVFAPLHARSTFPGQTVGGSFRWQAKTPHEGLPPKPLYEAPFPAGPRPFKRAAPFRSAAIRARCRRLACSAVNFAEVSTADSRQPGL